MPQRSRPPPRLLMNATNLARRLGVDHSTISRAIARGEIVPEPNGLIDVMHAEATFGRRRSLRAGERAQSREAVARREQAIITRTAAQVMMSRRKTEQARARLADRNRVNVEVNNMIGEVYTWLAAHQPDAVTALLHEVVGDIRRDLGDLVAEGLKVTRI